MNLYGLVSAVRVCIQRLFLSVTLLLNAGWRKLEWTQKQRAEQTPIQDFKWKLFQTQRPSAFTLESESNLNKDPSWMLLLPSSFYPSFFLSQSFFRICRAELRFALLLLCVSFRALSRVWAGYIYSHFSLVGNKTVLCWYEAKTFPVKATSDPSYKKHLGLFFYFKCVFLHSWHYKKLKMYPVTSSLVFISLSSWKSSRINCTN